MTCFFDLAEEEFKAALELDRQAGQPLYLTLTELSRLNLAQGKYPAALRYFERGFPLLDAARAAQEAPIGYADLLDHYAQALDGAGQASAAQQARQRAAGLRQQHPQQQSATDLTPYGSACPRTGPAAG